MMIQIYFLKDDDLCNRDFTTQVKSNVSQISVVHYAIKKKKNISHIEERIKTFQDSL